MKRIGKILAGLGIVGSVVFGSMTVNAASEIEIFSSKQENMDIMQKLVDGFNKSQDEVTVKLNAPADAGTVLKTRLAKNDVPDVLAFNYDHTMRELLQEGFFMDLSEDPLADHCYDEYKNFIKADNNEDNPDALYALPYVANAGGVIYNVDKFAELGVEIPKTWDEFMTVIEKIEEKGENPFLFPFKDSWTAMYPFIYLESVYQPENFEADRKAGKTTYVGTHEKITEMFLTLLDHTSTDYMGLSYADANKAFANGEAYMMINGNWVLPEIKKANPDCNVSMFTMPALNDAKKNAISTGVDLMFSISEDCKDPEGAKAFIEYMMQPEQAQAYIDDQVALSVIDTATQKDPSVSGIQDVIKKEKVHLFADMQIPDGMDLGAEMSALCLNYSSGMSKKEATAEFLADMDEKFDTAIMQ